MNADDAVRSLINDLRRHMRTDLEATVRQVSTGQAQPVLEPVSGRPITDPFTGKDLVRPVLDHIKVLHAKLGAAGLTDDKEFRAALHELLLDAAAAPVFRLLAVLDGEGELPGGVRLEVRVQGGERLPTHLHEILFPIDQDR